MDLHSAKRYFCALSPARRPVARLAIGAAALLACASLQAQTVPVEQFGLTAVNSNGNALYNVTVTRLSIPTAPRKAVFSPSRASQIRLPVPWT
jgi:hypothetical protein